MYNQVQLFRLCLYSNSQIKCPAAASSASTVATGCDSDSPAAATKDTAGTVDTAGTNPESSPAAASSASTVAAGCDSDSPAAATMDTAGTDPESCPVQSLASPMDFSNVILVPHEYLVDFLSRTNQVSVDENGNLLIPSSVLIDEGIVLRDSLTSAGEPPDIPLQTAEGSSNSSSNASAVTEAIPSKVKTSRKRMSNISMQKKESPKKTQKQRSAVYQKRWLFHSGKVTGTSLFLSQTVHGLSDPRSLSKTL